MLGLMGVAKMQFVIPVYQRVYSWSIIKRIWWERPLLARAEA